MNQWMGQATPESMGVSSGAILEYLNKIDRLGCCMHGFCLIRHNQVIAEGYYRPFHAQRTHRMYSSSKSMAALAIGLLQDEGKIALDDPIGRYFPEKHPEKAHPWVQAMTIRDMLRMATTFVTSPYEMIDNAQHDWVQMTFECDPTHRPGQVFSYDTSAATLMAALVEKFSGMELMDYLREKLAPLHLSPGATCVKTPDGKISWAGSGILCTQRDFAKLALLSLNQGVWEGEQLISRRYMELATSKQIDNGQYGYGYQYWMTPYGFAMKGMGGQMAYCMTTADMVLVTTADMQAESGKISWTEELFYDQVLSTVQDSPLPENGEEITALRAYCNMLQVRPQEGRIQSPISQLVSGNRYRMEPNAEGTWQSLDLEECAVWFAQDMGSFSWKIKGEEYTLQFGLGHYKEQDFPGFATAGEAEGIAPVVYWYRNEKPVLHMPCMASAAWQSDSVLEILCYAIGDFLGVLKIRLAFEEKHITVRMEKFAEKFWEELNGFQSGEFMEA